MQPDETEFADERQVRIAALVSTQGRVRNGELARRLKVSEPTIRKDLSALQRRGLLKRTHGGAIALHPLVDRDLAGRAATRPEAKEAIAQACLPLVSSGDSIFLDSGTTTGAIAAALAGRPPTHLSVLTTSLDVARIVADVASIEHVLLGGELRLSSGSVIGALTLHELQRFTVDVAFIGVSGFSDLGVSVSSVAEAEVKASVIERARKVVVPVDQTKIGATDFARVCGPEEIDTLVLDSADPQLEELCAALEIELVVAA